MCFVLHSCCNDAWQHILKIFRCCLTGWGTLLPDADGVQTLMAPKLLPVRTPSPPVHSIRAGLQRMGDGSNLWNPKYSTAGRSDVTEMTIKAKEGLKEDVQFGNSTVWWCPSLIDAKIARSSVNSVHSIGWYLQKFPDRLMNPTVWWCPSLTDHKIALQASISSVYPSVLCQQHISDGSNFWNRKCCNVTDVFFSFESAF